MAMQETLPQALEMKGTALWLQPEQQCQAWELWNRILQAISMQPAAPTMWNGPQLHSGTLPTELSTDTPKQYTPTNQRRSQGVRRQPDLLPAISRFGGAPWKAPEKVYEYSVHGLAEEIEDFYEFIRPKKEEEMIREMVVSRVRTLITERWPDAEVDVFGSFYTGLYLPTSDIDIIVKGHWGGIPPLYDLERVLSEHGMALPSSIKVLDKASVPLIKFQDTQTNIKVDIAFNQVNCTDSARFVIRCCEVFPCLKKLAFVFKQFVSGLCLNEVFYGGLSSYSLILMILSFLQLQTDKTAARDPGINLGSLLMDILAYYGNNFDYDKFGIRIRGGGCLVEKSELRDSMASATAAQGPTSANNATGMLSIEDPLTPSNDVARSSFNFSIVRDAFREAFAILEPMAHPVLSRPFEKTSPGLSILGRIIRITDAAVDERVHALENALAGNLYEAARLSPCSEEETPDFTETYDQLPSQQQRIQQDLVPGTVIYWNECLDRNGCTQFVPQPVLMVDGSGVADQHLHGSDSATEHDQLSSDDEVSSGPELPRTQEIDNGIFCNGHSGTRTSGISLKSIGRDVA